LLSQTNREGVGLIRYEDAVSNLNKIVKEEKYQLKKFD